MSDGPPLTVSELLTRQFYDWELRGRGWAVFPEPVDLEPPFRPFVAHCLPPQNFVDDGLVETPLSRFARKLLGAKEKPPVLVLPEEEEPEPRAIGEREELIDLQVALPAELDIEREAFEQFLRSLYLCREPVAFEILGTASEIVAQFAVDPADAAHARQELQAFFPDAVFLPREGTLADAWTDGESAIVEFGLGKEFMLPLASGRLDPFVGITGALAELQANELALFQVIFAPARRPWAESVMRAVQDNEGGAFFANAPELVKQAEKKIASPLYAAVARIATQAEGFERAWEIARNLAGSLRVFAHPLGNELIPLKNDGYDHVAHAEDVLRRRSRRCGMILNADELIGFVHLPSPVVRAEKLARQASRTKSAPKAATVGQGLILGANVHAGKAVQVGLTPDQRVCHTHVIGASGTGKSTFLFNLIKQDIEAGEGIAVLDPHGDLVDRVLGVVPEKRIGDVVLLDPSDEEYSVGFNFLSAHSELEKRLLASDLVSVFQRLSTSWGDQMGSVLNNSILAFLESSRGGTLADLRRFLLEPGFRASFLETVSDPEVQYYWHHAFPQLSGNKSIGPVLTRLETFLSPKAIRCMVSQKENRLDFAGILDAGKIFLAKLSQGLIGRENSYLLGTLLVAKFQQLAMSRQAQAASSRRPFWLYIDEFHNFITPSMAEILSGARKYRIGLILAHQELRQLQRDSEVASAVLSNPYTRVCFRVGDDDARKLADGFGSFEARDLQNLGVGEAICRIERSDRDCNLAVPLPETVDAAAARDRRAAVIAASREKYGTPRAEVEEALRAAFAPPPEPKATTPAAKRPTPSPKAETTAPKPPEARMDEQSGCDAETAPVPTPPEPEHPPETASPVADADLDRDEKDHTIIKERIGRQAETVFYTVKFEEFVPNSQKRVDLVLRRGNRAIACEVCVSNTAEYEIRNVKKCLAAGFREVAVICPSKRKLANLERAMRAAIPGERIACVMWQLPDDFVKALLGWADQDQVGGAAEQAKPRKQKIKLGGIITETERQARELDMLAGLAAAMKCRTP